MADDIEAADLSDLIFRASREQTPGHWARHAAEAVLAEGFVSPARHDADLAAAKAAGAAEVDFLAGVIRDAKEAIMRPGKRIENTIEVLTQPGVADALIAYDERRRRNRNNTPAHVLIAQRHADLTTGGEGRG